MEQYEGDVKKGKPKWMWWAIIGIVVVVVVVMVAKFGGGGQSTASGLTLDDLGAIVNQQSTSIQGVVTWKAIAMEDIANFKTKDISLQTQIDAITSPKDWTPDMNKLKADFTALQESWQASNKTLGKAISSINATIEEAMAGINITLPRYAMVSGMEEKYTGIYIDVSVYGVGDYPVLVSIYGQNLQNGIVSVRPNTGCILAKEYFFYNYVLNSTGVGNETVYNLGTNATRRDFVIVPTDEWKSINLIQMKAEGNATVSYAFAVVGDSWAKAEEEW